MKPKGVKSATPILKESGEGPFETTGTPPVAAPPYPGTPPEPGPDCTMGADDDPAAMGAIAGAAGADAATSFSMSVASSWVMMPFFTRSMSRALLLSVWAGASVAQARAQPRITIHFDFVGSMAMICFRRCWFFRTSLTFP